MTLQAYQLACTRGERQLFNKINFVISAGDAMRVEGTNGSGKTSLLRMLCGLSSPSEGEVRWSGTHITKVREAFAAQLIYLGHASGVKDDLLAWENVVIASILAGRPISRDEAYQALEHLGLTQAADLPTRALSQGQRKRVALARLQFGMATPLWILDEPFTALDQKTVIHLCRTLDQHLNNGGMVIYTTHQDIKLNPRHMLTLDLSQDATC
ncbi:MAG: cytochrome c biogenesis heme-transporting ATPase CcmA [Cytophaga sp.]|nr:cytochrome c biogenesis heme-transporting ATPase CcmA [Undibacterium sp.]